MTSHSCGVFRIVRRPPYMKLVTQLLQLYTQARYKHNFRPPFCVLVLLVCLNKYSYPKPKKIALYYRSGHIVI